VAPVRESIWTTKRRDLSSLSGKRPPVCNLGQSWPQGARSRIQSAFVRPPDIARKASEQNGTIDTVSVVQAGLARQPNTLRALSSAVRAADS